MFKTIIKHLIKPPITLQCNEFHLSATANAWISKLKGCEHFKSYNDKIYPPQIDGEPPRHAFVCHVKENIKYSMKKMWYIASLINGMSIDEALRQLSFVHKKGATAVKETLLEAQEMAIRDHNVEFKSNLWVSESFVGKGLTIKGLRRHARRRVGHVRYGHVHYFVTLEEGSPPEHFYPHKRPKTSEERLNEWLETMRKRKISSSL